MSDTLDDSPKGEIHISRRETQNMGAIVLAHFIPPIPKKDVHKFVSEKKNGAIRLIYVAPGEVGYLASSAIIFGTTEDAQLLKAEKYYKKRSRRTMWEVASSHVNEEAKVEDTDVYKREVDDTSSDPLKWSQARLDGLGEQAKTDPIQKAG